MVARWQERCEEQRREDGGLSFARARITSEKLRLLLLWEFPVPVGTSLMDLPHDKLVRPHVLIDFKLRPHNRTPPRGRRDAGLDRTVLLGYSPGMSERIKWTEKQRRAALHEVGYRCANPICHTTIALEVHHILEVHAGGLNEMANALAVCPTCHALFHKGVISRESIVEWKKRVVAINALPDIARTLPQTHTSPSFRSAAAEFSFRSCSIGLMRGPRFFPKGICTLIDKGVALTAQAISLLLFGSKIDGEPVIMTQRGPAPCELSDHNQSERLTFLTMGSIDDATVREFASPEVSRLLSEPLQTRVRYRVRPWPGDPVGILHRPPNTDKFRGPGEFQFERSVVSFMNARAGRKGFPMHTLAPLPVRVIDAGAPVFTDDSRLVGVVTDLIQLEEELGWRPVIEGLIGLHVNGFPYDQP